MFCCFVILLLLLFLFLFLLLPFLFFVFVLQRCDVSKLPLKTESLDGVHAGAALHCWSKLEDSLSEVYRVLKPGKGFFATTFLMWVLLILVWCWFGFDFDFDVDVDFDFEFDFILILILILVLV